MKSKSAVYFLVLLVIVVWGLIAYRIYSTLKGGNSIPNKSDFTGDLVRDSAEVSFKLIANYRDPFLGKYVGEKISHPKAVQSLPPAPILWPEIRFKGVIKNQQSNKLLVLVTINGKERIMKADQMTDLVTVMKIYRDSIIVAYKNENRVINKIN